MTREIRWRFPMRFGSSLQLMRDRLWRRRLRSQGCITLSPCGNRGMSGEEPPEKRSVEPRGSVRRCHVKTETNREQDRAQESPTRIHPRHGGLTLGAMLTKQLLSPAERCAMPSPSQSEDQPEPIWISRGSNCVERPQFCRETDCDRDRRESASAPGSPSGTGMWSVRPRGSTPRLPQWPLCASPGLMTSTSPGVTVSTRLRRE